MGSSKHAFWQALVFTIIVFAIGILLGFFLEASRADSIELVLLESEISLLDQQVRSEGIGNFDVSCELARKSTLQFADEIYEEVLQLETYDSRAKLDDTLRILHRRYDLLRMLLWVEAIEFKERCGNDFHTLVYLFEYATDDIETNARQASLSRLLLDVKEKHGDEILLIPIAANLNLSSVDLVVDEYGIEEFPVIILDEEKKVDGVITLSEMETLIFERDGFENLEGFVFEEISF